ncbi:MAG: DUF5916 domain-containing protein, partial [candidate division Zixibacteria bacterium]|nr:DUF5916 domain-containing protein [candidate division Zixibacteria bacterium]
MKLISIFLGSALLLEIGSITGAVAAYDRLTSPLDSFAVTAVKVDTAPKIDGVLDEKCWSLSRGAADFTQLTPVQEALASEATIAYVLFDKDRLYVGIQCRQTDASQIAATITNRDGALADDWVMVMLDPYGDHQSAYEFIVNPLGVQTDAVQLGNSDDASWDAVWESKGQKTADGWTVEIAIPFRALRFRSHSNKPWRIQFARKLNQRGEMSFYVPMRKVDNNLLARMADLKGLEGIESRQPTTLIPYATQKLEKAGRYHGEPQAGIDVKYAVLSNLVVDGTYNPDFSTVEADVDQINLTPYELSVPEKRPFFQEKTDIFQTFYTLFYSRRGVDPIAGVKVT